VIAPDAIRPPPEEIEGLSGDYLDGIAALGSRLVLLLNVDAILRGAEAVESARG
jgi:chemotaxis signal transduction protein